MPKSTTAILQQVDIRDIETSSDSDDSSHKEKQHQARLVTVEPKLASSTAVITVKSNDVPPASRTLIVQPQKSSPNKLESPKSSPTKNPEQQSTKDDAQVKSDEVTKIVQSVEFENDQIEKKEEQNNGTVTNVVSFNTSALSIESIDNYNEQPQPLQKNQQITTILQPKTTALIDEDEDDDSLGIPQVSSSAQFQKKHNAEKEQATASIDSIDTFEDILFRELANEQQQQSKQSRTVANNDSIDSIETFML